MSTIFDKIVDLYKFINSKPGGMAFKVGGILLAIITSPLWIVPVAVGYGVYRYYKWQEEKQNSGCHPQKMAIEVQALVPLEKEGYAVVDFKKNEEDKIVDFTVRRYTNLNSFFQNEPKLASGVTTVPEQTAPRISMA